MAMFWFRKSLGNVTFSGDFRIRDILNTILIKTIVQMTKAKFVKEVTVIDPDSKLPVEIAIYKHENGGMFGVDSSYILQVAEEDEMDNALVPDVFNKDNDNYVELIEE